MRKYITVKARFWGRVQGVGFRYTALQYADRLGLYGTVQNMPDNSVETVVQGPADVIENFLQQLESRFTANCQQSKIDPISDFSDFRII